MADIVILTGAGISAESGLGTFRDENGLWTQYDLEQVCTPEGFSRNPALVHEFYNARRANCLDASPNPAHEALARLQRDSRHEVMIVTQNVDDLHERAGAREVIHMHGTLGGALCQNCGARWPAPRVMDPLAPCPNCRMPETRPDIVWFGEMPYEMDRIMNELARAFLFVAIGTSGNVYPAAGFVHEARLHGARTLELNLEPSATSGQFDDSRLGPASDTVPRWVDEMLAAQ